MVIRPPPYNGYRQQSNLILTQAGSQTAILLGQTATLLGQTANTKTFCMRTVGPATNRLSDRHNLGDQISRPCDKTGGSKTLCMIFGQTGTWFYWAFEKILYRLDRPLRRSDRDWVQLSIDEALYSGPTGLSGGQTASTQKHPRDEFFMGSLKLNFPLYEIQVWEIIAL